MQYSSRNDAQGDHTDQWGIATDKWKSSGQWGNMLVFTECGYLTEVAGFSE